MLTMKPDKINENEYKVYVHDFVYSHNEYICGAVKRDPNADQESDLRFWMFHPSGGTTPMSVDDLKTIYEFISMLNIAT